MPSSACKKKKRCPPGRADLGLLGQPLDRKVAEDPLVAVGRPGFHDRPFDLEPVDRDARPDELGGLQIGILEDTDQPSGLSRAGFGGKGALFRSGVRRGARISDFSGSRSIGRLPKSRLWPSGGQVSMFGPSISSQSIATPAPTYSAAF